MRINLFSHRRQYLFVPQRKIKTDFVIGFSCRLKKKHGSSAALYVIYFCICTSLILRMFFKFVIDASFPRFAEPIPNVTVTVGRDALLACVVDNLRGFKVSGASWWIASGWIIGSQKRQGTSSKNRISLSVRREVGACRFTSARRGIDCTDRLRNNNISVQAGHIYKQ